MNTPEENREAYRSKCSYRRNPSAIEMLTTNEKGEKIWQQVFSGLKNAVKRESRKIQSKGNNLYVI